MSNYDTISTETWQILLPPDWQEQESENGVNHFESADGAKAIYLSTWRLDEKPARSAQAVMDSFRATERKTLFEMQGYEWVVSEQPILANGGNLVSFFDAYDRKKNYRIACKLIALRPWMVRSSFHDYDCTDFEASKRFFEPIIDSLRVHDGV